MSTEHAILVEIRDLLLVLAEPALAKRDERIRAAIRAVAGRSNAKRSAVLLMDGSRTKAAIAKESRVDPGDLTRLVQALAAEGALAAGDRHPTLRIQLPRDFFEREETDVN